MTKRILVVEDEANMAATIASALSSNNDYQVTVVSNAEDAEQYFSITDFDLLLLDCGLPDRSGIDVCTTYRNSGKGRAKVLFITGRGDFSDKEFGFKAGADDYLTKPFDIREMLLRVSALLRRGADCNKEVYEYKDLYLDSAGKLARGSEKQIKLAPREFSLLEFLIKNPSKYFSSDELLSNVWPSDKDASEDSVRVCVHRLRAALQSAGVIAVLENSHGYGYRLE